MAPRFTPPPSSGNRAEHDQLADSRFLVRWFRSALLEISGATKAGRAHGRFNEIARTDADIRQPWVGYSIEMVREQLHAAAQEGPDALTETLRRVDRAAQEWARACKSGFLESAGEPATPVVALEFTREATEAVLAVATYRESGSESDAERARREVQDVIAAGSSVLDMTQRRRADVVRMVR